MWLDANRLCREVLPNCQSLMGAKFVQLQSVVLVNAALAYYREVPWPEMSCWDPPCTSMETHCSPREYHVSVSIGSVRGPVFFCALLEFSTKVRVCELTYH